MTPMRLLALMALALAIPAAAQVMQVQPIQVQTIQQRPGVTPVLTVPQSAPADLSFDPALDPERARAVIAKLKAEKRALREQMTLTLGDLQQARSAIDEMTSRGGSLVRAQCVSDSLSRRTDGGGEENCAASGYTCAAVEGTCHRQCSTSNQCAGGFVCDTGAARCVVPVTSDE